MIAVGSKGNARGFSIIELMIAMLIGSLVLLGITSLFSTTSNVNRMENGLARLQESGRFAMSRILADVRQATAMRGMRKAAFRVGAQVHTDMPIYSFVEFGEPARRMHGLPAGVGIGGGFPYPISQSFFVSGLECDETNCLPTMVAAESGFDAYGTVPALGLTDGARAPGTDMITVRYLRGVGVGVTGIDLAAGTVALDRALNVGASGLVVIGDARRTYIVAATNTPTGLQFGAANVGVLTRLSELSGDIRANDFDSDFVTVTYYVRLNEDPNVAGRMISSLIRRENGNAQEIAQGIERLDFLYHVMDSMGNVRVMNAAEVASPGVVTCLRPDGVADSITPDLDPGNNVDKCGWRSVRAVEVLMLVNTIDDVGSNEEPFQYAYLSDGSVNTDGTLELACASNCSAGAVPVLYSGLPAGRMLRREFRGMATLKANAF